MTGYGTLGDLNQMFQINTMFRSINTAMVPAFNVIYGRVKLSLCFIKHHAIKLYMGKWRYGTVHFYFWTVAGVIG